MHLELVTGSTGPPITLDDAKSHLAVTSNDHDAVITRKLAAATEYCERNISGHRRFMQATYDAVYDQFPAGKLTLPLPPLSEVTSVKYYDGDGVLQTLSSTAYNAITPSEDPGFIEPAYGQNWPSPRSRADAVTVRFVAGSTSTAGVPETVKEAVRLKLEHLWDPERVNEKEMDRAIASLLGCYAYGYYG